MREPPLDEMRSLWRAIEGLTNGKIVSFSRTKQGRLSITVRERGKPDAVGYGEDLRTALQEVQRARRELLSRSKNQASETIIENPAAMAKEKITKKAAPIAKNGSSQSNKYRPEWKRRDMIAVPTPSPILIVREDGGCVTDPLFEERGFDVENVLGRRGVILSDHGE